MTVTLSSKGQVVLPKQARLRLQLQPGAKFICQLKGDSIVLTPETRTRARSKLVLDRATGLRITQSPPETKVTSQDVAAALAEFP